MGVLKSAIDAYNTTKEEKLAVPATYVVGQNRIVLHAFVNADYTQRLEPAGIVARPGPATAAAKSRQLRRFLSKNIPACSSFRPSSRLWRRQLHSPAMRLLSRLEDGRQGKQDRGVVSG